MKPKLEIEQKTIVITQDEGNRMADFCNDKDGNVSRDFYDWYLGEENYFTRSGMMIVEMDSSKVKTTRWALSFDLSNPDDAKFVVYAYKTQYPIIKFSFSRQDNLKMDDVSVKITYFNEKLYEQSGRILLLKEELEQLNRIYKNISYWKKAVKSEPDPFEKQKINNEIKQEEAVINKFTQDGLHSECRMFIYFTYALMYYVSKQEPEEITAVFNKELNDSNSKVKSTYKYSGYIDLRKNKTYKPKIKKDPNEPTRDYNRHIKAWTVRGHYRNINGKKVWIEPHTRGDGEVEKRIYGTVDEKDVNLIPQVFEVTRNANINEDVKIEIPTKVPDTIENINIKQDKIIIPKISMFRKIWNSFKSLFK